MKIALVTPGFSADEEDWCIPVLYNLVRDLAREHDIHVFTLRYPHRQATYPFHRATVHAFGGAARAGLARFPLITRALNAILAEARRSPFALIHSFWADEAGFLGVLAAKRLKIPSVVSLMGGEMVGFRELGYGGQLSAMNRLMIGFVLRGANGLTAGSRYLGNIVRGVYPSKEVHILPFGVDTSLFSPVREDTPSRLFPENHLHLLHAASLVPVKDQHTLLRAFAIALRQNPQLHLHLAGDGPLRPQLEGLSRTLGVSAHLTFHGAIPHHETPDYYRAADLCVLSSRFESQGMVILEGAACGVTTVGTAVGILPEVVPPDQVAAVGDAEALARCIQHVITQDITARGKAIQKKVLTEYSVDRYLERLMALYTSESP